MNNDVEQLLEAVKDLGDIVKSMFEEQTRHKLEIDKLKSKIEYLESFNTRECD